MSDRPFVSEAGGFRVVMPAGPKERTMSMQSAIGAFDLHVFASQRVNVSFMVAYGEYPAAVRDMDPDRLLENVLAAQVRRQQGTIARKWDVKLGKVPGKAADFSFPGPGGEVGLGRTRIYLAGARFYQVLMTGPADEVKAGGDGFLDSLQLLKPPAMADPAPALGSSPKKAATPGRPFVLDTAGFKVTMPGTPEEENQKTKIDALSIDVHNFVAQQGDLVYLASYYDLPEPKTPKELGLTFTGLIDGMTGGDKAGLVSRREIKYGQHPGCEFECIMKLPDGRSLTARSRAYVIKNRVYQVTIAGPKEKVRSPRVGDAYLKSFELTKKPAPR